MRLRTAVAPPGRRFFACLLALLVLACVTTSAAQAQQEAPSPPAAEQPAAEAAQPAEGEAAQPAEETGGVDLYINPLWLLLVVATFLFWMLLTGWISSDARGVGMNHPVVTSVALGVGAAAVAVPLLVHAAFAFLSIVVVGAVWGVYVVQRNKIVPAQRRILGAQHRAELLGSIPVVGSLFEMRRRAGGTAEGVPISNEQDEPLSALAEARPTLGQGVDILADLLLRAYTTESTTTRLYPANDQYVSQFKMDGVVHNLESFDPEVGQQVLVACSVFLGLAREGRVKQGSGTIYCDFPGDRKRALEARIVAADGKPALVINFPEWTPDRYEQGLEALGVHPAVRRRIASAVEQENGAVIFAGPPGSGKSTTMHATATKEIDIFTTEILAVASEQEQEFESIRQWPTPEDEPFGETFSAVLRESPDAIMLGEIGDAERAELALKFAGERGLVLATVEAREAAAALLKLKKLCGNGELVGNAVTCLTAQRLVRKLCTECKEVVEPNPRLVKKLKLDPEHPGDWFRPVGCETCLRSGYRGRIAIFEMLIVTDSVKQALQAEDASPDSVRAAAGEAALRTMYQDGLTKVTRGITTLEEIRRVLQGRKAAKAQQPGGQK